MKLIRKNNHLLIDEVFPANVMAGFTAKEFKGSCEDLSKVFGFLNGNFDLSSMNQIHSAQVHSISQSGIYVGDGLLTDTKDHLLTVRTADCLPLLLFTPKNHLIGVIHMGWRSAHLGILDAITADLNDAIVVAGLGLRACCYEVGDEFLGYKTLSPYVSGKNDKLYFDPVTFAKDYLCSKGLKKDNFYDINFCSFCMEAGFSYRKNSTENRTISFIMQR
jgi:purine-nucleoside/S-methyl-5'-thioadenosine phosphorylase / adenosine deaminase